MSRMITCAALVCFAMTALAEEQKAEAKPAPAAPAATAASSVLDFTVKDIDGKEVKLADKFAGKVLLIVNTASKCGYTPQYEDLEALYQKYHEQGLEVLGFPSNDFGAQEPGTDADIKTFCTTKFKVTFPMFSKIPVKGDAKAPLYVFLTDTAKNPTTGGEIKWNFTKFLVGRDGKIVTRFESKVKPSDADVTQAVEKALGEKSAQKAQ